MRSRARQLAMIVTGLTCLWIYLLKDDFPDSVQYLMMWMWVVFLRLLYKSTGDPGVVTTQNEDLHGYGIQGTNYCEQCGANHPERTFCSPATKRSITRFDHHNPLLKLDVGLLNYNSYYSMLIWSALWLLLIWYHTSEAFYIQHDPDIFLFKYIPSIPFVKHFVTMIYMVIESWTRFTYFLYSLGCLPIRYGYFSNKDVPWFITTSDDTQTQLLWGLYYIPMTLSVVASWYCMAGLTVFITHIGILAASNMTIEEEVRAVALPAIPEERWKQFSSVLIGVWTEVIGVLTTNRMYRYLHVYGGDAPSSSGYVILDTSLGLKNAYGTIPTHLSKYDLGFRENMRELWTKKRAAAKPDPL